MQSFITGVIAVSGPIGALCSFFCMGCGLADAAFPVPKPGSRWIGLRRVVSLIGLNFANAQNRILPGSLEAVATVSQVLQTVLVTHAEAEKGREQIVATLATKVLQ